MKHPSCSLLFNMVKTNTGQTPILDKKLSYAEGFSCRGYGVGCLRKVMEGYGRLRKHTTCYRLREG